MRSLKRDDPSCTPWLLTDQWQSLGDHPSTCSDALIAMVRERERVVDATILSVDSTTSGQDHLCKVHLAWSSHEFTLWVIASASFSGASTGQVLGITPPYVPTLHDTFKPCCFYCTFW